MSADAFGYDAWRDELAVPCPYATDWESARTHGPVLPPDVTAEPLAVMPPGTTTTVPAVMAGRAGSVRAPLPTPLRGGALTDHPVHPDF